MKVSAMQFRRLVFAVVCLMGGGVVAIVFLLVFQPDPALQETPGQPAGAQAGAVETSATGAVADVPAAGAAAVSPASSSTASRNGLHSSINPQADAAMRGAGRVPQLKQQADLPTVAALQRLADGGGELTADQRDRLAELQRDVQQQARQELSANWQRQFELRTQLNSASTDARQARQIQFELARLMTQEREATGRLDEVLKKQLTEVLTPEQAQQLSGSSKAGQGVASPVE